jgi:hypothetical protein
MVKGFGVVVVLAGLAMPAGAAGRADHLDHFGWSAAGAFGGTLYLRLTKTPRLPAVGIATFTVLSLGLFKELAVDRHIDRGDVGADVLGTALGGGLHFAWKF